MPQTVGVRQGLDQDPVDIVVADTLTETEHIPFPTVVLSEHIPLAVPALDPRQHNPIGWRRRFKDSVAALGPLDRLPTGAHANRVAKSTDVELIRHCHHLEDVAAFHASSMDRARTLLRLAAAGIPIQVTDNDPALEELLGVELSGLLKTNIRDADPLTRELHSIRARRIAHRDHSHDGRIRQIYRTANLDPPQRSSVSILLATNRPESVRWALGNVDKQNYPQLEVVLALHGDGFNGSEIKDATAQLSCPVEVICVSSQHPLAVVLDAASQAASGTILTKMDDDDLYDADHILDLVLAREYSGAHLVGKGAEVVYLQQRDQTVERHSSQTERYSTAIAGGTLMISRDDLVSIGGWGVAPRRVDKILIDNVVRHGGVVYRTHGRGYVVIRHGGGHTWNVPDPYFLDQTASVHAGWQASLGGFDVSSRAPIHIA